MYRCIAFLSLGLVIAFGSEAAGRDSSGRPPIAEDLETRFEGRFLFTTNGEGAHVVYQKIDAPSSALAGRDVVCMMNICYAEVVTVPSAALEEASGDKDYGDRIRERFKADRDAYEMVLRAAVSDKAAAEQVWRGEMTKLGECLKDRDACSRSAQGGSP